MATVHAQWAEARTFSWVPQGSPSLMTQRRMLRHNAIGLWRQCSRPAGFETRLLSGKSQVVSELSRIRGCSCHLNVDLPADVHPCPQSEVHAIGTIDEFLELLCCDSLADFPDAKGRALRANGTERMVVEARFQVFGYSLIPATTWRHRCLCRLPPLLGFACAELVMNMEELRRHSPVVFGHLGRNSCEASAERVDLDWSDHLNCA